MPALPATAYRLSEDGDGMNDEGRESRDLRFRIEELRLHALVLLEEVRRISERLARVLQSIREDTSRQADHLRTQ